MDQIRFQKGFLIIFMLLSFQGYTQDALEYMELNDKVLEKCLKEHKDTLACYDAYFRALDSNVTDVYIEVNKKLPAEAQVKLEKSQAEWQQKKHYYYGKNYTNFIAKFPKGDFANPSPEEKRLLAEGYKNSALYARKRIVYLLSLIGK